ncbi:MAG: hypothetical protein KZQ60_08865, partial [Candidatus Thiodiazotropha sp. (ex Lucinoma aequizonata)]|nr:hypothetical protein [Candidatus Thiodiazotropha sp. (ex Lucinoma aequizonata)]
NTRSSTMTISWRCSSKLAPNTPSACCGVVYFKECIIQINEKYTEKMRSLGQQLGLIGLGMGVEIKNQYSPDSTHSLTAMEERRRPEFRFNHRKVDIYELLLT